MVRYRQLQIPTNLSYYGFTNLWVILVRESGDVDTLEAGQSEFEPVFHARRLNDGGKVRIHAGARAQLNFADKTTMHFLGPLDISFSDDRSFMLDGHKIFDLRWEKVMTSIERFFGRQFRFEINIPRAMGGRG